MLTVFIPAIIAAYLLGSAPFGLVVAAAHGKNLRSIGSGNIGATNVARALGRKWGYVCFVLDMLKGLVPMLAVMLIAQAKAPDALTGPLPLSLWLTVGCAAVLGHIFPIYLRFKGGKGVSTSLGVALGLWPYFTGCALGALVVWILCVLTWRYISLASLVASVVFPLLLLLMIALHQQWNLANLWPLVVAATIIPILVAIRHRQNIGRLLAGTEHKISSKRNAGTSA